MEIFISVFALFISIITMFFQQKHNKNSVIPLGRIIVGDYEDDIFVKIVNSGTGPLIVEKLYCNLKNEKITDTLIELLEEILENEIATDFVEDITNRVISPNKEIILFRITREEEIEEQLKKKLRQRLSDVTIEIKYKDIYNQSFIEKRKLNFFGRHFKIDNK